MYSRLNASRVNRIRLLYLLEQIHSSRLFNAKNYCWMIYFVKKMPPLPRGRDGLVRPWRASQSHPTSSRYTHNDGCNRNDNPSPLHPFRPVIVSVGEEESAKLNYNKLFEHDRRANGALFVTPGTRLCGYRSSRIMYWLLLLAFRPLLRAQDLMPM